MDGDFNVVFSVVQFAHRLIISHIPVKAILKQGLVGLQ
jgi:hypothetical protein